VQHFLLQIRKEGVSMTPFNQHNTHKKFTSKNAANTDQGMSHHEEALDEETLNQITGGQTSWKSYPGDPNIQVSSDNKFIKYYGAIMPNSTVHLD
jgi:hypothetical protein